jgi:hypothetical protein
LNIKAIEADGLRTQFEPSHHISQHTRQILQVKTNPQKGILLYPPHTIPPSSNHPTFKDTNTTMPSHQSEAPHTANNATETASIASSVSSIRRIKQAFTRRRRTAVEKLAAEERLRMERSRRAEVLFLSVALRWLRKNNNDDDNDNDDEDYFRSLWLFVNLEMTRLKFLASALEMSGVMLLLFY